MEWDLVLNELRHTADRLLERDTEHEQIVLVKTAAGTVYYCLNCCTGVRDGYERDEAEETALLDELRREGNTEICAILAVWNSNIICGERLAEMPSFHIRKGLLALDPRNTETVILTDGTHNRRLADSMPI